MVSSEMAWHIAPAEFGKFMGTDMAHEVLSLQQYLFS
jgi:hypothetical protein